MNFSRRDAAKGYALLAACLMSTAVAAATSTVPQWDSYQGNNEHTGYVPMTVFPSAAKQVWEWRSPHATDGVMPFINPVTVSNGKIAVSDDDYFSPQALYVLKEADGTLLWKYEFPSDTPGLNPATIRNGHVYVATSGHEATFMHSFDAASGTLEWKSPFQAQWPHFLAPTVDAGLVATAGGYYGGVYGFSSRTGGLAGSSFAMPMDDMFTPAIDDQSMYVYATNALYIIDRHTFATSSIADPAPTSTCCYSYIGAPMLSLARQRVVALSGDNFSGLASASTGGYYQRAVVSFDLVAKTLEWRSSSLYITQPALAHGLVFAGGNTPVELDALDETSGTQLWKWVPQDNSSQFCRNVIVTDSHVFVSTDRGIHAIDLSTHKTVWSFPVAGEMALSANGTLLINEGCRESTGRMVAVRMPKR